jgi:hypothetical protein
LLIGGQCRVGLEDNLYLEKGRMAKSNAEQVAKMVRIAKEFGVEPATPDESRKILGLKGIDKVNYYLNQWHALCGLVYAAKIGLYPSIFDPHTGKLPAIWGTAERSTHLTC